jgi:uracil-DNA glycosylase family 4
MNDYRALLDSTAEHLQALKNRGVHHLAVRGETLAALEQPVAKRPTAPTSPVAAILPAQSKEEAMREIRERALACVMCPHLVRSRKNVVFGVGDIHSPLMFVGEAPGADEDIQGEPFVGAAGELLTKIIRTMGFSRESVYIANVLKCRPDTPGQTSGNRKPTPEEMKTCLPYLLAQIDVIRPKIMVALGATAIEGLLGRSEPVGKLRGKFLQFRDIPLMPTYHPAYLIRNQALSEKRKVWEDMLQVLERLAAPISEKQRGYFLPAPSRNEMAATA